MLIKLVIIGEIQLYKKFNFSIIIIFNNNEEHLKKSINSILNQTLNFKRNIQLILFNNNSNDNSKTIALDFYEKYPDNILYIEQNEFDEKKAKISALSYVDGEYINFLSANDYISENSLKNVYDLFKQNEKVDFISLPINSIGLKNDYSSLTDFKGNIIDLTKTPIIHYLNFNSLFIKSNIIENSNLRADLNSFHDEIIISNLLLNKPLLGIGNGVYYLRTSYDIINDCKMKYIKKSFYFEKLNQYESIINHCLFTKNEIPLFIQLTLLYHMQYLIKKYEDNIFDSEDEITQFTDKITSLLTNFSQELIAEDEQLDNNIKDFLIYLKNDKKTEYQPIQNNVLIKSDDYIIDELNNHKIYITDLQINEDELSLNGSFTSNFPNDKIKIYTNIDNEHYLIKINGNYIYNNNSLNGNINYLSKKWIYTYDFQTNIPIKKIHESEIFFEVIYDDNIKSAVIPEIDTDSQSIKLFNENNKDKYDLYIYPDKNKLLSLPYCSLLNKNNSFKFSIVMAINNTEKYIEEAINSVINQDMDFKENIQLVLVKDCENILLDSMISSYKKEYPENIITVSTDNNGVGFARNVGLIYAEGEYINFLDSDDYLSKNCLNEVYEFFDSNKTEIDVVSIPMEYFDREEKPHELNYKYSKTRIINLNKTPNNIQKSISSAFIKKEVLNEFSFNNELVTSEDSLLINQILLEKRKYGVLDSATYYYRKRFSEDAITDIVKRDKRFFTPRLKHFHKYLIDYCTEKYKEVPEFIQFMLVSDLESIFSIPECSIFEDNNEKEEFWSYFDSKKYNIFNYISDKAISKNRNINKNIKSYFRYLKKGSYEIIKNENDLVVMKTGKYTIDTLNKHKIWFDIIDFRKEKLIMSGHIVSNFANDSIKIRLVKDGLDYQYYDCEFIEYSQPDRMNVKYLGTDWLYDYNFNITVPLKDIYNVNLHYEIVYNENDIETIFTPGIGFRVPSGLTEFNTYFVKGSRIIYYRYKTIFIRPYSYLNMLKHEKYDMHLIKESKLDGYSYILFIRMLYMILYPFMKNKHIWTVNDRIDNVDENGMHLFRYLNKQDDGIKKYYIISKDCEQYDKLSKEFDNLLIHGSFKHKIIYLFSEKTISAFLNESFFNPFWIDDNYDYRKLYCNLITTDRYFLQHGVISCDLTNHIKRYKYNLALIVTSADAERQSFFDLKYNYPETVVQALGLPRYDNLTNDKTKKQLVFLPTWRSYLDKDESLFVHSDYYNTINSLINNDKLHKILEEYGYEFIFKPHPELIKHMDKFDNKGYYKDASEVSFQDIFRESSLLISDFSSVVFDFVYLKKPIIYYQPNDDYHFDEAYFDYETMGFGEVVKDENELIELVERYFKNNCEMDNKYKERVDTFFKYNDKNNCKRVYEWIRDN